MSTIPFQLIVGIFCFASVLVGCADSGSEPGSEPFSPEQAATQKIELHCDDEQKYCTAALPPALTDENRQQTLVLRLQSPSLPALKPLQFELMRSGASTALGFDEGALVRVWIEGRDMFMGEHRLESSYDAALKGFVLDGIIPVCVTGSEMIWRLSIELIINNSKVLAYADLRSLKHS